MFSQHNKPVEASIRIRHIIRVIIDAEGALKTGFASISYHFIYLFLDFWLFGPMDEDLNRVTWATTQG
jgi:hypothetical protein